MFNESEDPLLSAAASVTVDPEKHHSTTNTASFCSDDDQVIKTSILARVAERFRFLIPPSRLHEKISESSLRFMLGLDPGTRKQRTRDRAAAGGRRSSRFPGEDEETTAMTLLTEEVNALAQRLWELVADMPQKPTFLQLLEFESEHFPYTTEEQRQVLHKMAAQETRTVITKQAVALELGIISSMHHFGFEQQMGSGHNAAEDQQQQQQQQGGESLDDNPIIKCLFGPINEMPRYVFSQLVMSLSDHPNTSTFLAAAAESVTVAKKNMSLLLPMCVVFFLSLIVVPTFDVDSLYRSGFTAAFPGTDDYVDGCPAGEGPTSPNCHALKENMEVDLTLVSSVQSFFQNMVISQVWPADLSDVGNATSERASNSLYFGHVLVGGMILRSSPLAHTVKRERVPLSSTNVKSGRRTVVVSAGGGSPAAAAPASSNSTTSSTSTVVAPPATTTATTTTAAVEGAGSEVENNAEDPDSEVLVATSQDSNCPMRTCESLNLSSSLLEFRIAGAFSCDSFSSSNSSIVVVPFNTTRREALAIARRFAPEYCDAASDTAVTLQYAMYNPNSEVLSFVTMSAVVPRAGFVLPRMTVMTMNLKALAPVTLLLLAQVATFAWVLFFAFLRNLADSSLASAEHIQTDDTRLLRKRESLLAAARRWRSMSPSVCACVKMVTRRVFAATVRGFFKHVRGYFTLQILWQASLTLLLLVAWALLVQLPTAEDVHARVMQAEFVPPEWDEWVGKYNLAMDIVATFFLIFFLASCQLLANVLGLSTIWRLLVLSAPDVVGLMIVFWFTEMGFVGAGRSLFGAKNSRFAFTSTTSAWLLDAYFGVQDMDAVLEQSPEFGLVFFFLHLAFAVLFALNMLIACICANLDFVSEGASLWKDFLRLVESDASNFREEEERWFELRKVGIPIVSVLDDAWILSSGSRRWGEVRRCVRMLWRPQTRTSPTPTPLLLENAIKLIEFCTKDTVHCFPSAGEACGNEAANDGKERQEQQQQQQQTEEKNTKKKEEAPALWNTVLRRAISKYDQQVFPDRTSWIICERIILGQTNNNLLRDTVLARILLSYDEYTTDIQKIIDMQHEQRERYANMQNEQQQRDKQRERFYREQKMKIAAAAAEKNKSDSSSSSSSDDAEEMKEKSKRKRRQSGAPAAGNETEEGDSQAQQVMKATAAAKSKLTKSLKKIIFARRFGGGTTTTMGGISPKKKGDENGAAQQQQQQTVNLADLVNFSDESEAAPAIATGGISFGDGDDGAAPAAESGASAGGEGGAAGAADNDNGAADDLLMMSFARAPVLPNLSDKNEKGEDEEAAAAKRKLWIRDRWKAAASSAREKHDAVEKKWVSAATEVKKKEKVKRKWKSVAVGAKEKHDAVEKKWRSTATGVVERQFEESTIAAAADLFGAEELQHRGLDDSSSSSSEYEEEEEEEQPQQQQQHIPQTEHDFSSPTDGAAVSASVSAAAAHEENEEDFGNTHNNFVQQEIGISFDESESGSPKKGTFSSFHVSARKLKFLFNQYLIRDVKNHLWFPLFSFVSALLYIGLIVPILEHRESGAWLSENLEAGLRDNPYITKCDDAKCTSGFLHRKEFNDIAYSADIAQYMELRFVPLVFPDRKELPFVVPPRFAREENITYPVGFDPFIRRVSPVTVRQVRAAVQSCSLPGSVPASFKARDPRRAALLTEGECYGDSHTEATTDLLSPPRPSDSLFPEEAYRYREGCVEGSSVAGHFASYPCAGVQVELHNASQALKELPRWLHPSATLVVISATFRASLAGENVATDVSTNTTYGDPFSAVDGKKNASAAGAGKSSSAGGGGGGGGGVGADLFASGDFEASNLFGGDLLDASVNLTARIDLYIEMIPGGGNAVVWAYTHILSENSLFRYSTAGFMQIALELLIFFGKLGTFVYVRLVRGDLIRAAHTRPGVPFAAIGAVVWTLMMLMTPSALHLKHSRILAGLCVSSTWLFLRNVVFPVAKIVTHRAANLLRIMELSLTAFWSILPYMFLTTVAFIWSSHLYFGREVDEMATLRHTVRFVVRGLLFEWDMDELSQKRPYLSLIVTMAFFFVVLCVITNLLLTLMTGAITEAREVGSELIERTAGLIGQKLLCDEAVSTYLAWHTADDNILKRIFSRVFSRGDSKAGKLRQVDAASAAQGRQFFVTRAGRLLRPAEAVSMVVACNQFSELSDALALETVPERFLWSIAFFVISRRRKFVVDFRDQATLDAMLEAKHSQFGAF